MLKAELRYYIFPLKNEMPVPDVVRLSYAIRSPEPKVMVKTSDGREGLHTQKYAGETSTIIRMGFYGISVYRSTVS